MMRRKSFVSLLMFLLLVTLVNSVTFAASSPEKNTGHLTSIDPSEYRRVLDDITKTVPLTYNEPVKKMINYYLSSQKSRFSRMLGLSEYYFPIYEKIFTERGVPEEIKYLSIVESSLNPLALSSAQAGGLWQFLEPVGKIYGLAINDTIDERRDPVLACNAAASYLLESYNMYKDWLLAIASYNCGRNNIRWAMEKNPSATDYWSIREYLPVETQNYVPAYIATVYLMNNSRRHGIYAVKPEFNIHTQEVTVNRPVSLSSVSKALNIDPDHLYILNAEYKNQIINGSPEAPKKLVVPQLEEYIYKALCDNLKQPGELMNELKLSYIVPAKPSTKALTPPSKPYKAVNTYILYKVQPGDTLESIVEKFNSTEEEIKLMNRLKHYSVKPGMVLKIIEG